MKLAMKRVSLMLAFFGLFVASAAFAQSSKTITIVNKCTFNIDQIYLSHISDDQWGEDILGSSDVLEPDASVEVEIDCDEWDVKLVAPDGSTCIVKAVQVCEADTWEITADCGS